MLDEQATHGQQRFVASLVAVDIVNLLEIVKVDVKKSGTCAAALQALEPPWQLLLEKGAAVEQLGEGVGARQADDNFVLVNLGVGDAQMAGDVAKEDVVVVFPVPTSLGVSQHNGAVDGVLIAGGRGQD